MKTTTRKRWIRAIPLAAGLVLAWPALPAFADDDRGGHEREYDKGDEREHHVRRKPRKDARVQDEVLKQLQQKTILPLETILQMVRPRINGELIASKFEIEKGVPIYEFKYIDPSGRVLELYADARTGDVIKEEIDH